MRGTQLLSLLWVATAAGYVIRATPPVGARPLSRSAAPVAQFGTGNYNDKSTDRKLTNFFSPISGDAKVRVPHCRRTAAAHAHGIPPIAPAVGAARLPLPGGLSSPHSRPRWICAVQGYKPRGDEDYSAENTAKLLALVSAIVIPGLFIVGILLSPVG